MTSPVSPSLLSTRHDKAYYLHGGDLVFLVENILFRVHRYFFERESVYFKTLLEAPHPENEPAPGSSDSSAIMLDTTASQFSRFVWVFYNPKYSIYDEASLEDWKSILELSHRWLFPEVKELAIRELQKKPLTPVQRIVLYHRNFVDRNLLVGDYLNLCQRAHPLSLHEGLDLGLETTLMIARTREEIRSPRSPEGVMTPLTPTLQGPALMDHIGKMFVDAVGDAQPQSTTTSPVITVNGSPNPNAGEKAGSGGPRTPGGLAPRAQPPKQTGRHNQNQNQNQNQKAKGNQNQQQATKPTKPTTTPTPETTKDVNSKGKADGGEAKAGLQIQTSVAGQQAGAGGSDGGAKSGEKNGHNQENSSNGPKAEGDVTVDAQAAGTTGTGGSSASNGDAAHTNGGVDKDKRADTQKTPTATKPNGDSLTVDVSNVGTTVSS